MGNFFIDKATLEKEEQEALEKGISIFQLRHYKKLKQKRQENLLKKRKEARLQKQKDLEKEKRKKQKEKLKLKKLKEREKEKVKIKKEREKIKKQQWLLEHPFEKPKKKRPVGRPKKRGPKKKYKRKKKIVERKYNSWNYKIISCRNGKQNGFIGKYLSIELAYEALNKLTESNKDVIFPSLITHGECGNAISDSRYEYLLLERKISNDSTPLLRNEFGKLVEQHSNSETWNIIDKRKYQVEETFWVWGFNNKTERKTFSWIYNNILIGRLRDSYDIKRVLLYKNKVIIKNDDESMDIIFCKTKSDAFRFYQLMENKVKEDKIRQIFFIGSYDIVSDKRRKLEEQLIEMTGWPKKKIQMSSTSEHKSQKIY